MKEINPMQPEKGMVIQARRQGGVQGGAGGCMCTPLFSA